MHHCRHNTHKHTGTQTPTHTHTHTHMQGHTLSHSHTHRWITIVTGITCNKMERGAMKSREREIERGRDARARWREKERGKRETCVTIGLKGNMRATNKAFRISSKGFFKCVYNSCNVSDCNAPTGSWSRADSAFAVTPAPPSGVRPGSRRVSSPSGLWVMKAVPERRSEVQKMSETFHFRIWCKIVLKVLIAHKKKKPWWRGWLLENGTSLVPFIVLHFFLFIHFFLSLSFSLSWHLTLKLWDALLLL